MHTNCGKPPLKPLRPWFAWLWAGMAILLLLALSACRDAAPASQALSPATAPASAETAVPAPLTATPAAGDPGAPLSPDAAPTAVPPTATPTPTATPRPPLELQVPANLAAAAAEALAQLNQAATGWEWYLALQDEPAPPESENPGPATIRLVSSLDAQPPNLVRQAPLALAVPFVTEWEEVSAEEAQTILRDGHALVRIVPWAEMPRTHKALRIDGRGPADPAYPLQQSWRLQADAGLETAVAELLPRLQAALPPEPLVHLAAVGDIMLDRSLGAALQRGDLAYPFVGVAAALRAADLTVGNLESALGDVGAPQPKRYPFRAPPEAAAALALAGFDLVSLANNHGMDYGPEALLQALALLEAQGVATVGAGANAAAAYAPHIFEVNGLRLAFLGYVHVPVEYSGFDTASWTAGPTTPGLAWGDPAQIRADVTAVAPQVDLVIVLLHSGHEYVAAPSAAQMAAARAAVEAGAHLVIGHHAHILQGIEFYGEGVIVYGTGNFAFEIDGPPETAVYHIWLDRNGVREIALEPAIIQFGGQPRLAETWEAAAIRRQVYSLTRFLNLATY